MYAQLLQDGTWNVMNKQLQIKNQKRGGQEAFLKSYIHMLTQFTVKNNPAV